MDKSNNNGKRFTGVNRIFKSETVQTFLNKRTDGTFKEFFGDWKWIFSYSKRYAGFIVIYTILGIISASLGIAAAYIGRILINIIVEKEFEQLGWLIAAMLLSTIVTLGFNCIMSRISAKISIYVNNDIQAGIFDQIIDAKWSEVNKYQNGDLVNRFNSDVNTISSNAIAWIPDLIINIYTFALTFFIMLRLDVIMAMIAVISAPLLMAASRIIMRKMREYRSRVLELNSQMMSFEVETFTNFDTIKSFGIIDLFSGRLRNWQSRYKEYNLDYNKFEIKAHIAMTLVSTVVSMTAFLYCLYRLWTGQILYGDMTFFLQQRSSLTNGFNKLVQTFPGMINSAISAHRVRELVELAKEEHDEESLRKMEKLAGQGITVEMCDASFFYREGMQVYKNGNFIARPGEIVAVLGGSGEGKTTLLKIILGLIAPQEGSVTLTGIDGEKVPINADLRKLFSYVPQGNTVLSGTVAENLRMVKPEASDAEIVEALKTACAWEFVEKLPDGMDTVLGDNGKGLSVGQNQRLSIARAILRDSPILMLDEATSALDVDTERRVLENIIQQRPNKTCIVSTHRLSVLEQCHRVYKIQEHSICEIDKRSVQSHADGAELTE